MSVCWWRASDCASNCDAKQVDRACDALVACSVYDKDSLSSADYMGRWALCDQNGEELVLTSDEAAPLQDGRGGKKSDSGARES